MGQPQLPQGYTAERVHIRQAGDGLLAEMNALQNEIEAEARPELPRKPVEETINEIRTMRSSIDDWSLFVRDRNGNLIGRAGGYVERTGDNEHVFDFELQILPSHRRLGIGAWALAETVEAARSRGATLLTVFADSTVTSAEGFARWAGFELALVERESDLILANVDWDMVQQWVREGPGRAPDYRLDFFEGLYPEEIYDDVIAWQDVMNTAPREALQVNDEHMTREELAEREARLAASSKTRLEFQARHLPSGVCIGGTALYHEPWIPTVAWQGATAVHPDHRGHALGKWLKAAMLLKLRELIPQVEIVRTGNAYSNDPMLGINDKLGFKETRAHQIWQAQVAELRARLGR